MDAAAVCQRLNQIGLDIAPKAVRVERRDDRWAALLPNDRIAWFPTDVIAARRLAIERRVLDILAARCAFRVPRVLHAAEAGWQLRDMVPGRADPSGLVRRLHRDHALARSLGHALGGALAEQHARVLRQDTAGWLPTRPPWPKPILDLVDVLPRLLADATLVRDALRILRRYEAEAVAGDANDHVLVHGDFGLHNIALMPETDALAGVFDYDSASWADRHQDFRYLLLATSGPEPLLDAALEIYESALAVRLDRYRIRLCNAACALGFLADRRDAPPEARPCGRTLAEDLDWVRGALSRVALG